jgi:hypothetical protein
MSGISRELTQVRDMLDGRYDEMKGGRALPVEGWHLSELREKNQKR